MGNIKLVQEYPVPEMFTCAVSQGVFYLDNVLYTDTNQIGSSAYLGSYTASYVPYSLRNWVP